MRVELDKKDLISLVKGTSPYFSIMDKNPIDKLGYYNGSNGSWVWVDSKLEELHEGELYGIYLVCRKSWDI